MNEYTAATPDLLEAATAIFNITKAAGLRSKAYACPHGNLPVYPSHAWWCDDCWNALEAAIAKARGSEVPS